MSETYEEIEITIGYTTNQVKEVFDNLLLLSEDEYLASLLSAAETRELQRIQEASFNLFNKIFQLKCKIDIKEKVLNDKLKVEKSKSKSVPIQKSKADDSN